MADAQSPPSSPPVAFRETETTAALLELVRAGDRAATDRLLLRCLPALRRWAHGRLPTRARGMVDTDDLVQVSVLRALNQVGRFEPRREGAFLAYLRRILLNAVRDEIRRVARRPTGEEASDDLPDRAAPAVEQAIGRETMQAYEEALAELSDAQQEAVILRVEFGYTFPEIAEATGGPSANAARMLVARALVHLAEAMDARR